MLCVAFEFTICSIRFSFSSVFAQHEVEVDMVTNAPFPYYENLFRNPNRIGSPELGVVTPEQWSHCWKHDCTTPVNFTTKYDYGNAFYAYNHGLVHIVALSSYSHTDVQSAQYQWLDSHRHTIDRTVTPWVTIIFHSHFYTTFRNHLNEEEAITMKESMEPLFLKMGANLVVCGHDHAYLRTHPLYQGKVDPSGLAPVYLTVGAGGNREERASYRHDEPEAWVAKRDNSKYGYGHFHAANATHARWNWVEDGNTIIGAHDDLWFINAHV